MTTILIVDDNASNRSILSAVLVPAGYRILEAADGAEGLDMVRAGRPDLVIADILMPTMDGYEFVRQLRADPAIAATRVVFCTAYYHEAEAQNLAAACSVSRIITKPIVINTVVDVIKEVLEAGEPVLGLPPPVSFDSEHVRLLTDRLARNVDELARSNERLSAMLELSVQLGSERDPQRLLQGLCNSARRIIGAHCAMVGLVDDRPDNVQVLFASGLDAAAVARLRAPDLHTGAVADILSAGCARRLQRSGDETWESRVPEADHATRSWLGVPLASPTRTYGWLGLADRIGLAEFTEEDERLAVNLGAQVGRIYEGGRLYLESRQAEQALAASEERFRQITENLTEVTWLSNAELTQTLYISPSYETVFGYPCAEVYADGLAWLPHVHPDDRTAVRERLQCAASGEHVEHEFRIIRPDGRERLIRTSVRPIHDDAGNFYRLTGTAADITETYALEQQLRQAQKMEAVGTLAGGVAHDFNNLLTVIGGYADLLQGRLAADARSLEMVHQIKESSDRAASLTRQLLAFSRKQVLAPTVLDLNKIVSEMGKMIRRLIGEDVEFSTVLHPGLGQVRADPGQVEQVILNLVVNARDAMPTGGNLTIETRNIELDDPAALLRIDLKPGAYSLLSVSDTGMGMSHEVRQHIFEPFFTTKGPGRGTGLGLATVFGIIKQSGGGIQLFSEVGRGSTFKVYLPHADGGVPAGASVPATAPRGGSEVILLVEDDANVRSLVRMMLEVSGYHLLEAMNGDDAIRLSRGFEQPIDLLLTDVVMPRMSGRQLADALKADRPAMKVLFISGYTDDAIVRHGVLQGDAAFLQKPFTASALTTRVRELLEE